MQQFITFLNFPMTPYMEDPVFLTALKTEGHFDPLF